MTSLRSLSSSYLAFLERHPRLVTGIWIAITVFSLPLAVSARETGVTDPQTFLPEEMESVNVQNVISREFPVSLAENVVIILEKTSLGTILDEDSLEVIDTITSSIAGELTALSGSYNLNNVKQLSSYMTGTYLSAVATFLYGLNLSSTAFYDSAASYLASFSATYNSTADMALSRQEALETALETTSSAFSPVPAVKDNNSFLSIREYFITPIPFFGTVWQYYLQDLDNNWNPSLSDLSTPETLVEYMDQAVNNSLERLLALLEPFFPGLSPLFQLIMDELSFSGYLDGITYQEDLLFTTARSFNMTLEQETNHFLGFLYSNGTFSTLDMMIDSYQFRYLTGRDHLFQGEYEQLPRDIPGFPSDVYQTTVFYLVSRDNKSTVITLSIVDRDLTLADLSRTVKRSIELVIPAGYDYYLTGDAILGDELQRTSKADIALVDILTIVSVLVVLTLIFQTPITAVIAIMMIASCIIIVNGIIYFLSIIFPVNDVVFILVTVISFAMGTDYFVFLLARYREERTGGETLVVAIEKSLAGAGRSVTVSAAAIIIGCIILLLSKLDVLQIAGICISLAIAVSLVGVLTILPSLIFISERKLFFPKKFPGVKTGPPGGEMESGGSILPFAGTFMKFYGSVKEKTTRGVKKIHARPVLVLFTCLITVLPSLAGMMVMEPSYDLLDLAPDHLPGKIGLVHLQENFDAANPAIVTCLVELEDPFYRSNTGDYSIEVLQAVNEVERLLRNLDGSIITVKGPLSPLGQPRMAQILEANYIYDQFWKTLQQDFVSESALLVKIDVFLNVPPQDPVAFSTVQKIRTTLEQFKLSSDDPVIQSSNFEVGGLSALYKDLADTVQGELLLLSLIACLVMFLFLAFILRNAAESFLLLFGIVLSVVWTLGASSIYWVATGNNLVFYIPLLAMAFIIGIGADFGILLVTRIKEEIAKTGNSGEKAVRKAFTSTIVPITGCGLVTFVTFASLFISPLIVYKQAAFVLCLGVFLDVMVIRLIVIPSLFVPFSKFGKQLERLFKPVTRTEPET